MHRFFAFLRESGRFLGALFVKLVAWSYDFWPVWLEEACRVKALTRLAYTGLEAQKLWPVWLKVDLKLQNFDPLGLN